jgi:ATP-binding cassette subfamily B protein
MTPAPPDHLLWPLASAGELLGVLAQRSGLSAGTAPGLAAPDPGADVDSWLGWAGRQLGIDALPVTATVTDLLRLLHDGGPALLRAGPAGWLALAGQRRGRPLLLAQDGRVLAVDAAVIAGWLTGDMADQVRPGVERMVNRAGIAPHRAAAVAAALVAQRLADQRIAGLTLLRLPAAAGAVRQGAAAGLWRRLAQIAALLVLLYGGELWSWQMIGGATLSGRLDWGWLLAWLLLGFTIVPARLLANWIEAMFALDAGRLVKSRLLAGALALPPDAVKRQGVGRLIGRLMEAQALEGQVLGGGFAMLVGTIELGFAGWVLSKGAAATAHLVLLGLFLILTIVVAAGYHRRIAAWSTSRMALTDHLVEAMIGHRTRLAQDRANRRAADEDGRLAAYQGKAKAMDSATLGLGSGLASAWLLAGLALLAPALAQTAPPLATALAVSMGGLLLAQRALAGIGNGLASLSRAGFSWGLIGQFVWGGRRPLPGLPPRTDGAADARGPLLEGFGLHHGHAGSQAPTLAGVDLAIHAGDRILIEGPSGGGKSTLAGLLAGQRAPDAGLLLFDGLDAHSIGDDWPRLVALAPQFHDNHILTGPLAFNLLMGRRWPPTPADLADAQAMCERLGLGPMLQRMPGGLFQPVGETGWQLSHGERSRIFLARALLQRAPVTILDESFAALDPATMAMCLDTALADARTLVVIAHP